MSKSVAIGIDLGTTNFRVGIYRNGRFEIICNEENRRKTPCYVSFVGNMWTVGNVAQRRAHEDIRNTIFSTKRIIGRTYGDVDGLTERMHWPFEIINSNGKPKIRVDGGTKEIYPIEISARILCKAREMAENYLQREVTMAVITVPECFTSEQKLATIEAGSLAGLKVLDIITDPMAAAISYVSEAVDPGKVLLVLSVGGGSCDVSILSLESGKIEKHDSFGRTDLGGQDIDAAICEHYISKLKSSKYELDKKQYFLFLEECRKGKENLLQCESVEFSGEILDKDVIFVMRTEHLKTIDKAADFVSNISKIVEDALTKHRSIDEAVVVGGCTRMTCLLELLHQMQVRVNHILDVDEAIVHGAACHAYALCAGEELLVAESLPFVYGGKLNDSGPSKKELKEIRSKLQSERKISIEKKERAKIINDFESVIYRTQKDLIDAGYQERSHYVQCCVKGLQWIENYRSSASNDDIRTKHDKFLASIPSMQTQKMHRVKCEDETISALKFQLQKEKNEHQQTKEELQKAKSTIEELKQMIKFGVEKTQINMTESAFQTILLPYHFNMQCIHINGTCYIEHSDRDIMAMIKYESPKWVISEFQWPLSRVTMVSFDPCNVYIIGGYDRTLKTCSGQISIYDTLQKSSNSLRFSAMPTKRYAAVATKYKKYIIVAGGWKEDSAGYLSNVEVLDTSNDRWNSVSELPFLTPGMKHATHDGKWYLVGEKLYTVSLFELVNNNTENVWNILPDTPFKCPGIAIVDGNLLVIGDQQIDGKASKGIYCYQSDSKTWIHKHDLLLDPANCYCILLNGSIIMVC